jgi:hypothetical protein
MFRKILLALAGGALLTAGLFSGYAASQQTSKPLAQAAGHDVPVIKANGGAKRLMVQEETAAQSTTSTTFTALTSDSISIPATGKYRVVVRFSGESQCIAVSWCSLRILVGGVEANPKVGTDFAFDSPGGSTWESDAIERTSDVINGGVGSVTVEVDWAVVSGGTWVLDDWSGSAELWKV